MKIIAFGHRKRVGKDTASRFLLSHLKQHHKELKVARFSFGDQIKRIAHTMYKWGGLREGIYYENHPELKEANIPTIGLSPRQIWDALGLFGHQLCGRTWAEMTFENADADIGIVTDLRRPSEVEFLQQFGGVFVRVERDVEIGGEVDRGLLDFHGWNATIHNNETLRIFNKLILDTCLPLLGINQNG